MNDQLMIILAQRYLQSVGELPNHPVTPQQFLQHCVDVYNKRKECGLEPEWNEEEQMFM